ncbi:unnamed protein product [Sphagnum troendelagicum]|uniref:UBA domain-containing protein n=1 Tax=Sphagnum troendelagicum TaxID=128251 RepID=A0ABP0UWB1_9BRYO
MNVGPAGFYNAPVTKGIVLICGLVSVLVGTQGGDRVCSLSYQKVVQKLELWRLVTSPCVFSSTPELLFGLYLVYFFRVFERQIGSNKYLVFLLFSTAFTTILEVVTLAAFRGISLTPGPYGLIFASFVPFFFDIPISTRFKVFGGHFSDKSFVYLAGLQLLLSSWKRSLVPGICGIIAGFIYKSNVLRIRRAKFPEGLAAATAQLFSPFMSGVSSPSTNAPPLSALLPPPEESVSTLVAMGFIREDALQALAIARNDMATATNFLLESQVR